VIRYNGQVAGSDHYVDVFIAGFPPITRLQVDNQITKFLEYEKKPQTGAAWYAKALGVASNQGVGQGIYGLGDWQFMNLLRGDLLHYSFTQVDSVYDPWGTQAMITNYVNDGRGMINYCGHGSATSWGTTDSATPRLTPWPTIISCGHGHGGSQVGNFTGTTCFCEAWLRASTIVTIRRGRPLGFFPRSVLGASHVR